MKDLNANTLEQAVEMIKGTCVSMGIEIKGELEMKLSKNLSQIANQHDKTVPYSLDNAVD